MSETAEGYLMPFVNLQCRLRPKRSTKPSTGTDRLQNYRQGDKLNRFALLSLFLIALLLEVSIPGCKTNIKFRSSHKRKLSSVKQPSRFQEGVRQASSPPAFTIMFKGQDLPFLLVVIRLNEWEVSPNDRITTRR